MVGGSLRYLDILFLLVDRHTVSELSDEMKSLIIEKSRTGLGEEPETLVKGECDSWSNVRLLRFFSSKGQSGDHLIGCYTMWVGVVTPIKTVSSFALMILEQALSPLVAQ